MKNVRRYSMLIVIGVFLLGLAGRLAAPVHATPDRVRAAFFQDDHRLSCTSVSPGLRQLDLSLEPGNAPFIAGRVISLTDGTLAALVIVTRVNEDGAVTRFDVATSIRVAAVIIRAGGNQAISPHDPPVRSVSGLGFSDTVPVDDVAFCYRISLAAPPALVTAKASSGSADATPASPPTTQATRTPARRPTPTAVSFDLDGAQTAAALATSQAMTVTAGQTDVALAAASAQADATRAAATIEAQATAQAALRETATAASQAAASTVAAQQTQIADQAAQLATAQSNLAAASAENATFALTAAVPTPTPDAADIVFTAASDAEFALLQLPSKGWSVSDGLHADGSIVQDWVQIPTPGGITTDYAVEAEIEIDPGGDCPRNFGMAIRGSEAGYFAGGWEWACDPTAKLWAGQEVLQQRAVPIDQGWHLYRLEAIGSTVRLLVDGVVLIEASSDTEPSGAQVGIWSAGVRLSIRAIRVIDLT